MPLRQVVAAISIQLTDVNLNLRNLCNLWIETGLVVP